MDAEGSNRLRRSRRPQLPSQLHKSTIHPPYIHKSSNILLDGKLRAKVANFGLARSLDAEGGGVGLMHLTRHVVGTQGYMAPEYIENGVIAPKMDVFAFGVVLLELLSGREAVPPTAPDNNYKNKNDEGKEVQQQQQLLWASIEEVVGGENVREKLRGFMDASLGRDYPLDLAFSMAQLAMTCVSCDLNSRPSISEAFVVLSKLLSSSLDWDPSDELQRSQYQ